MKLPEPQIIDTEQALRACVDTCRRSGAVAVDTEFMRTDTFFPILGLIQISDGRQVWLIDPLEIGDFSALEQLFSDKAVTKVFHACSEDLEVLRHQLGLLPVPVFDTQVAAAFVGHGYSRSYSGLVERVLGVKLDKHETRSDWLRRPLTPSQCQYAAEDVYFLVHVYWDLLEGLERGGRSAWMAEEMSDLLAGALEPEALEEYYLRVKGAWKLSVAELALLRELTCWREREARIRNRPRNRIAPDALLLELIQVRPRDLRALHGIEGCHSGFIRRYGETLLTMLHTEPDMADIESLPAPLDRTTRNLLGQCREMVDQRAQSLDLAPELLARKKDLEALIRARQQGERAPERMTEGWRRDIIGQELYRHVAKAAL
ncbi:MAG: ribonuclease D [Porticoccaceae bacterium]